MNNTITTINEIKNEIKALYGADVKVFGQPTTLSDAPEDAEPTIDIIDVLDSLEDYEISISDLIDVDDFDDEIDTTSYNDVIDILYNFGYIVSDDYDRADNSYNWSSPVNHDFNYKIYKATDGGVYVTLEVHRYGDVRGNYTDDCLLYFDNDYTFLELLSDNNKYIDVEINGVDYDVEINIFSDGFEVYQDGEYITTVYGYDMEDIKTGIMEAVA